MVAAGHEFSAERDDICSRRNPKAARRRSVRAMVIGGLITPGILLGRTSCHDEAVEYTPDYYCKCILKLLFGCVIDIRYQAMATAAFVDLLVDPKVHKLHNRMRNRRLLFLLCLMAGAVAGAFVWARYGSAVTLFICVACKAIVMFLFCFNEVEKDLSPAEH